MYEPIHFRVEDVPALHAFIRARPLGLLVLAREGRATADAIPFLLDEGRGALGVLRAHVARANPLWRDAEGAEALVVFQGPDHYVSPGWYPSKARDGRVVPTWNYAMAQARGRISVHVDNDWLRAQTRALTDEHERAVSPPWSVDDAPTPYMEAQLAGVVGLEIEIQDLRGKFKLSQNKSEDDQRGVAEGLARTNGSPEALRLMASHKGSSG